MYITYNIYVYIYIFIIVNIIDLLMIYFSIIEILNFVL